MNNRTDNIDEMSIEQLRDELRAAWKRLHNVRAVLNDDFESTPSGSVPMREDVAGDVQTKLHHMLTRIAEFRTK